MKKSGHKSKNMSSSSAGDAFSLRVGVGAGMRVLIEAYSLRKDGSDARMIDKDGRIFSAHVSNEQYGSVYRKEWSYE